MVNESLAQRACRIKLVATDIDGVWTDATMYYGLDGELMKGFSTYDGMATALLRTAGLTAAIMTSEDTPIVRRRAEKLGLEHVYLGVKNKLERLKTLCAELGVSAEETAYIGDDLNDLDVLQAVGLSAMPSSSPILDRFPAHYVTRRTGGQGAFREFVDLILRLRSE